LVKYFIETKVYRHGKLRMGGAQAVIMYTFVTGCEGSASSSLMHEKGRGNCCSRPLTVLVVYQLIAVGQNVFDRLFDGAGLGNTDLFSLA
jgi:hypothetical protein